MPFADGQRMYKGISDLQQMVQVYWCTTVQLPIQSPPFTDGQTMHKSIFDAPLCSMHELCPKEDFSLPLATNYEGYIKSIYFAVPVFPWDPMHPHVQKQILSERAGVWWNETPYKNEAYTLSVDSSVQSLFISFSPFLWLPIWYRGRVHHTNPSSEKKLKMIKSYKHLYHKNFQ